MFVDVAAEPHGLRGRRRETQKPFLALKSSPNDRPTPAAAAAHLALLDGVGCSFLQQLDGLVVVQRAAPPDHVAEKLDRVQLPVRILGSGVVHQADLLKQENVWDGSK